MLSINKVNQLSRRIGASVASDIARRSIVYTKSIESSRLIIEKNDCPKNKTPFEELLFGHTFTDHMLEIDWTDGKGWHHPRIFPYQDLPLPPAATALHYGIQCFEGMKAYKDTKGKIRLFRPDKNIERMDHSMRRLAMPGIKDGDFLECLKELIKIDESWVPDREGFSLYIRPTAIGTSPYLGVHASEQVKVFTILSPVGPYYKSGFKPVRLLADTHNVRAWPGGVGNAKVGGNYAPTILPTQEAAKRHGCSQILWLYGEDHHVTEVGAMNIFFVFRHPKTNEIEIATPSLVNGDILPGVTRASIVELARTWPEFKVSERHIPIQEIIDAQKSGNLLEAFGSGTAAVISPVKGIVYKDEEIHIPTGDKIGPIAERLWKELMAIQYGRIEHPWSVVIN